MLQLHLATNQPTKLDLESCGVELEFTEVDDDIWTNRMTFLLAKTVNFCFGPAEKTMERWTALKGEVDLWKERAPASFKPFYTQPQGFMGNHFLLFGCCFRGIVYSLLLEIF